jgi:integrase
MVARCGRSRPDDERPKTPREPWPTKYRWSPHELRHSAASLLIAQGVSMKIVSETLGHASIRITSDATATSSTTPAPSPPKP